MSFVCGNNLQSPTDVRERERERAGGRRDIEKERERELESWCVWCVCSDSIGCGPIFCRDTC